jgi:hypothetical protein
MTIQLDADTEATIDAYRRSRNSKRKLIMQMLNALGLDVQNWREARFCLRALKGR